MRIYRPNLLGALLLCLIGCSRIDGAEDSAIRLTSAGFSEISALATPIAADQLATVGLPHTWLHSDPSASQWFGYYRLELPEEIQHLSKPSIYLPRWSQNGVIYLNNVAIHYPGNLGSELSRNWNRPQLAILPNSALASDSNILEIRLQTSFVGHLSPILVGEYDQLTPIYKTRYNWQQHMTFVVLVLTLAVGIFMLTLWGFNRSNGLFLYCSLTAGAWSLYLLGFMQETLLVDQRLWWTIQHASVESAIYFLTLFCNRFSGRDFPKQEKRLRQALILSILFYALATPKALIAGSILIHSLSSLWILYIAIRHWRWGNSNRALGAALLIYCLFSWFDVWIHSPLGVRYADKLFDIGAYSVPIILVSIAWYLAVRFTNSMQRSEYLSQNLEAEVSQHHAELSIQFEEINKREIELASSREVQQIYTSLHDELSEKMLVLLHTAPSEQQAELARAAIADLREASQSAFQEKLEDVFADCLAEAQRRCQEAEIPLEWEQNFEADDLLISSAQNSCIRRVLRESLSNIFKHANASRISISLNHNDGDSASGLCIVIEDNGVGTSATQANGQGINSIKSRLMSVNGQMEIAKSSLGGFCLRAIIPLRKT